ncbi:MAG: hypothetical protein JWR63_604 [Conexibacter sp.]|nr:hypothetical protein [Conexibacter sp.]
MRHMSRRDLLHVLNALGELAGGEPGTPVAVAAIDEAVGRGRADMRTPLNLASLEADGLVEHHPDDTWSLTPAGAQRHREDEDYAGR